MAGIKLKIFVLTFGLVIFSALATFADPTNPCDDPTIDPDDLPAGTCSVPLDTWVYVLVFAAIVYGAYRLYQKQKALAI